MAEATIVATLVAPPAADGRELSLLPSTVKWLEVRADLAGDLDPDWLRGHFDGNLLYSLRSKAEGGTFEGSTTQRRQRLLKVGRNYDLIDLEGDRDLLAEILDEIPPNKRLISWRGPATSCFALRQRLEKYSAIRARIYKLVPVGAQAGQEMAALSLLKLASRPDR